ncbi:putative cysteine desulfurase [compost metagenome]
MLGAAALDASLSLLEEVGMEQVSALLAERVQWLYEGLAAIPGVQLHSPEDPQRRSGIVSFSIAGVDNAQAYNLLKEQQVICITRGPGVRFSPHFYTPRQVIDETLAIVRQIAER